MCLKCGKLIHCEYKTKKRTMFNVQQTVNPDHSFVMGRNGLWAMKALNIRETGSNPHCSRIVFDCISAKRGVIVNGGFSIDGESFDALVTQIINGRTNGYVGPTK